MVSCACLQFPPLSHVKIYKNTLLGIINCLWYTFPTEKLNYVVRNSKIDIWSFCLIEKSEIYVTIVHVRSFTAGYKMPFVSLQSQFSVYAHRRLQVSTKHLCTCVIYRTTTDSIILWSKKNLFFTRWMIETYRVTPWNKKNA